MNMHAASPAQATPSSSAKQGITRFSIVRIVLATVATCVPVALVLVLAMQIPDKALRAVWPQLLAALAGLAGYLAYVRKIEKRPAVEFSGPGQGRELGAGLALGALLYLAILGIAAAFGDYRTTGTGSGIAVAKSFAEMVLVALVEEILFRGVVFRLCERSLGTWLALLIGAAVFALAHLPNDGVTLLAVGNTAIAGVLFCGAYLLSRRLWLPIGVHFAWNFVSDGLFSMPTSGHPGRGLLQGSLGGPEWLTGGAYGLEASAVTFVVLVLVSAWLLRRAWRAGTFVPLRGRTPGTP